MTQKGYGKIFKMKCFLLILLFYNLNAQGQNYESQLREVFIYNISLNACLGGIGGVLNKKPEEKTSAVFLKNFSKGALGGLVKSFAKYQTYNFKHEAAIPWVHLNRATYFLGHSMVMNSAQNEKLLSKFYFNLWAFQLEVDLANQPKIKPRISIPTLYLASYTFFEGHKFDFIKSLEFGVLYFDKNRTGNKFNYAASARFNIIINDYYPNLPHKPKLEYIPHELVHIYQYYDFMPIGKFYKQKINESLKKYKMINDFNKVFTLDHETFYFKIFYLLQPKDPYNANFFEFEAKLLQMRSRINR